VRLSQDPLSRRLFLQTGTAALAGALLPVPSAGAQSAPRITTTDLDGATLFQGAGCNVVAIPGSDPTEGRQGVPALMIDGGLAANVEALLAAVKSATGASRIHTLINTHWHPEQTGANEAVGRGGGVIFAHEKTKLFLGTTVYSAVGIKGRVAPLPDVARPNRTTRGDGSMDFGGLAPSERSESRGLALSERSESKGPIHYGYMPAAHTDGDLYVHIPKMNLLVVGGVVSAEEWPLLDYLNGAWLGGRVRALERLAGLVTPDTRVVPANGRVMTGSDIVRHRDMYQKLFSTMIGYLNMGLGPEDAVERNPLEAYEAEFGDASEFEYGALRSMMIAYVPD
jgi:cyclase